MNSMIRRGTAVSLAVAACAWIAGCDDSSLDQSSARSQQPISGAVLAKIFVLVLLILFIQRRPRGMFPLKGRAVET